MITRLYIESFGGIRDKEILLGGGLNIILGKNESGKTTICAFIRAMLYGVDTERGRDIRRNMRKRFMPVGGGIMSGVLETDEYIITRTFGQTPKTDTCTAVNKHTGEVIPTEKIGYTVTGMNEACFCSTFYMNSFDSYPKSEEELLTRLSDMSGTGDGEVSYDAVCAVLENMAHPYTKRSGIVEKALEKARTEQAAYENEKKQLERQSVLKANYEKLIKKRADAQAELERLEKAREKLAAQTIELRNRQRVLFEEMAKEKTAVKKIRPVPAAAAVLFGIIGLMFVFAYKNPAFLLCMGAFVPMVICLKLSGILKSGAEETTGGAADVQLAAIEKIMEKTGAAETADVDGKIKRINDFLVECASRIGQTEAELAGIVIDEGAEQRAKNAKAEYEKAVTERDCINVANLMIKKTYDEMKCDFMPELNRVFSEYFSRLTAGRYTSAAADRQMRLSVIGAGGAVGWEYLSGGTLDGAYFALRLALCRLADKDEAGIFVLDDAFLQYDDERVRNSVQMLSEEKRQTIYFTCRENFGNVKCRLIKI